MNRQHHSWTIDAIEEDVVRVEVDGERVIALPAWILPAAVREGDVLQVSHQRETERSVLVIARDPDATRKAVERSARQLADMPLDGGVGGDVGGDIVL